MGFEVLVKGALYRAGCPLWDGCSSSGFLVPAARRCVFVERLLGSSDVYNLGSFHSHTCLRVGLGPKLTRLSCFSGKAATEVMMMMLILSPWLVSDLLTCDLH